ncbi:thiol:disulfide interchange protein DsbA/DsbL [Streptacidiphilus monticola]|uniref:Thiol:disulfide interchange protein DsbA n=1 Tax=Streptacidiphilus monticola TaxID=2161674 RepID=A0ABW1FX36_9ACTN
MRITKLFRGALVPAALLGVLGLGPLPAVAGTVPQEGREYVRLATPVAGAAPREVVEVFWYNCRHSQQLEQPLDDWAARQHPPVTVRRIPAAWPDRPDMMGYARLYYTLDALGVAQRYALPVFHAVRDEQQDLSTEPAVLRWARSAGLDPAKVQQAYESAEVQQETEDAPALRDRYQVDEMPTVVVGGAFRTSPFESGGVPQTVDVLDYLYQQAG